MMILVNFCSGFWRNLFDVLEFFSVVCLFVSDLIDAFSDLPRDLNFVQHSSRLGWKL